jgi:hypothetical protein
LQCYGSVRVARTHENTQKHLRDSRRCTCNRCKGCLIEVWRNCSLPSMCTPVAADARKRLMDIHSQHLSEGRALPSTNKIKLNRQLCGQLSVGALSVSLLNDQGIRSTLSMMDNHRQQDNSRRQAFIGDLPQWNSRFRFSAQKKPPTSKVGHTNLTSETSDDAILRLLRPAACQPATPCVVALFTTGRATAAACNPRRRAQGSGA